MDWVPVVEFAAGACAAWAAWASLPRPPELNWERLFKSTLSVLTWSRVERELREESGKEDVPVGDVEVRWRRAVADGVPFHPAGRQWFRKLVAPDPEQLAVPALPGERALVETLARLATPQQRWERLFGQTMLEEDLHGAEALGDPRGLGRSYDPQWLIGPEAGWEGVSEWSAPVRAGMGRRMSHIILLLTDEPRVGDVCAQVDGLRVVESELSALAGPEAILELMEAPSDRLVWIHGGSSALPALQQVAQSDALVDRLLAFVALGDRVSQGETERAAMLELCQSERLVPELQRRIPLVSVSDVDPGDPTATDVGLLRFPALDESSADRPGVQAIDLGPLCLARVAPEDLGRAMLLTLVFLLDA